MVDHTIKPGTPVYYFPLIGGKEKIPTRTRSEAWQLGDGSWVVLVEGRTGGVWLEALEVRDE